MISSRKVKKISKDVKKLIDDKYEEARPPPEHHGVPPRTSVSYLPPNQTENLRKWKYKVVDLSLSTKLMTGYWNFCASWVPRWIAPNVLTLMSAISNVGCAFAALRAQREATGSEDGIFWSAMSAVLCFAGQTLDAIDGKHARNTGQSSPLGEYWDHGCDACTAPLLTIITVPVALGLTSPVAIWIFVFALNIGFREPHCAAMISGVIYFDKIIDVGEGGLLLDFFLVARAVRGNVGILPPTWQGDVVRECCAVVFPFGAMAMWGIIKTYAHGLLGGEHGESKRSSCRRLLICTLMDAAATAYGVSFFMTTPTLDGLQASGSDATVTYSWTTMGPMLAVALVSSVATCDSILAKMCGRKVAWWIPVFTAGLHVMSFMWWRGAVVAALVFHLWAVRRVCKALGLPFLRKSIVVYTDGVFDMCHMGHFNLLRRAKALGDKLIVGVGSDLLCASYKRKPLMNEKERKAALMALPWPTEVVLVDDFVQSLTVKNLKALDVDVVAHGEEYDPGK